MTVLNSVHHINFVVSDIDESVRAYQRILGLGPFEFEDLLERGVRTARTRLGDVWIVLVSPQDEESIVGRYLREHGEGFLLLSFGVDDLDLAMLDLSKRGAMAPDSKPRSGILGWPVADLDTEETLGARFHLTQHPGSSARP
ncbi:MAG TPA: VOC family protein [Woeseiaceae bacterium]|nr:VOC family protein [Woeseiaceae bacterium]